MKRGLLLLFIFCALKANAQSYLISFAGTGASTTVNSVQVENLTSGIVINLNGGDVLHLTTTVGISDLYNERFSRMKVYPNPMTDQAKLLISAPVAGDALISVCDITGKIVTQIKSYLENTSQEFALSGFKNGLYIVNVKGHNYQLSGRLLSQGKAYGVASIGRVGDNIAVNKEKTKIASKGEQETVNMEYTAGDILKMTGESGNYITVVTDIPSGDKTITFNFVACTDGDGNNYPVVTIGTQTWMAESLKTTKYNDDTNIPLVLDNMTWNDLSSPAYCWYNNDGPSYKEIYGALYNVFTVRTGKLCPSGWHMPSDPEWTTLSTYLGSSAGGKMKSTNSWTAPNTGATNETGFTALPGGLRSMGGYFSDIGVTAYWWSTTEMGPQEQWSRSIVNYDGSLFSGPSYNINGLSVRCIKD